jgi:hypothetical protein
MPWTINNMALAHVAWPLIHSFFLAWKKISYDKRELTVRTWITMPLAVMIASYLPWACLHVGGLACRQRLSNVRPMLRHRWSIPSRLLTGSRQHSILAQPWPLVLVQDKAVALLQQSGLALWLCCWTRLIGCLARLHPCAEFSWSMGRNAGIVAGGSICWWY